MFLSPIWYVYYGTHSICVPHAQVFAETKEGIELPGTRVPDVCELLYR